MNKSNRPLSVMIVACVYVIVGIGGFASHFNALLGQSGVLYERLSIETTELAALIAGVFLFRAHNWARWLAVAWIAFHVALSFGKTGEFAIHCVFCAGIAWALFRPPASQYFRGINPN